MSILIRLLPLISLLTPVLAFAQTRVTDLKGLICLLTDLVRTATPLAMGLALLAFIWGLANFILRAGDPKKVEEGKQIMLWGVIALFVLGSLGGIIEVLGSTVFGSGGATYGASGVYNRGCY